MQLSGKWQFYAGMFQKQTGSKRKTANKISLLFHNSLHLSLAPVIASGNRELQNC